MTLSFGTPAWCPAVQYLCVRKYLRKSWSYTEWCSGTTWPKRRPSRAAQGKNAHPPAHYAHSLGSSTSYRKASCPLMEITNQQAC